MSVQSHRLFVQLLLACFYNTCYTDYTIAIILDLCELWQSKTTGEQHTYCAKEALRRGKLIQDCLQPEVIMKMIVMKDKIPSQLEVAPRRTQKLS